MENTIKTIICEHRGLWGDNRQFTKINTGFTNAVYSVNNSFIIKICSNGENEPNFLKEIEFYKQNGHNSFIPTLYRYGTDKLSVPFCYRITEKINGTSLYGIWHTLNDFQREETIKQLVLALKQIHCIKGEKYDWAAYNKERFVPFYLKACRMNLFTEKEKQSVEKAFSKFDELLPTEDFVLVHNDIHFDNVFYTDKTIKLIDFERSLFAPLDFELDILWRMVRKPWKFADEKTEKLIQPDRYKNIMEYIKKYYPQLFSVKNLACRLAVYDMIYFLRQYVNAPDEKRLKEDVLYAAECVLKGDDSFLHLDLSCQ